jgi:WD40 repeat protein
VLAFSPRGDVLAVANADRAIYLIALRRPESIGAADETSDGSAATASLWPPFRLGRHDDAIWDLAFSPTGQWLASASHDRIVRLWGLYSGRRHALYGHTQSVGTIAFSPDGALLASGSDDQTIRVWSLDDASPLDAAQLRARIETLTTVQIDAAFTARTPQTPAPR